MRLVFERERERKDGERERELVSRKDRRRMASCSENLVQWALIYLSFDLMCLCVFKVQTSQIPQRISSSGKT